MKSVPVLGNKLLRCFHRSPWFATGILATTMIIQLDPWKNVLNTWRHAASKQLVAIVQQSTDKACEYCCGICGEVVDNELMLHPCAELRQHAALRPCANTQPVRPCASVTQEPAWNNKLGITALYIPYYIHLIHYQTIHISLQFIKLKDHGRRKPEASRSSCTTARSYCTAKATDKYQ